MLRSNCGERQYTLELVLKAGILPNRLLTDSSDRIKAGGAIGTESVEVPRE